MDQIHREADTLHTLPDNDALHKTQPNHLRNFQNNLQPRQPPDNHVHYERVNLTYANLILPVTFLGVTILGIIFVFIILILWWKNISSQWSSGRKQKTCEDFVKTMAEFKYKVEVVKDVPTIVTNDGGPNVSYVEEKESARAIVTTRNYGGSSPNPDGDKTTSDQKEPAKLQKFVFPEQSDPDPNTSKSEASTSKDTTKFKIPLPEQTWLKHKKPFEYKTYTATIPRPLAEVVKKELGEELNIESCTKKFSVTRSPSLEKDDKSPFVCSGTFGKSEVFGFEPEKVKSLRSGNSSLVVEVRVQPRNEQPYYVVDQNFNNNVKPISPKLPENTRKLIQERTISLDVENENKSDANLKRFRSVNNKLNSCHTENIEAQQEKAEMQNSPRILECGSANEKSAGTKFNFSPKHLFDNNSPKFFTPTDNFSPRFFAESSPKSVYYDSVRSPKFFPDTPKSPLLNDNERRSASPKAFNDIRNNGAKLYSPFDQLSPRMLLSAKPKSPKVYNSNKENFFDFDNSSATKKAEFKRQHSMDEVDNACAKRAIQRYSGRKSIERERVTQTEKLDVRRYRRHNSCETSGNIDNGNSLISNLNLTNVIENLKPDVILSKEPLNDNEKHLDRPDNAQQKGDDVLDCCVQMQEMKLDSPKVEEKATDSLAPKQYTAHERRQRLKSISLDSDNAKIIEQNLGLPIAKHLKHDNLTETLQDYSTSCCNVKRSGTCETAKVSKTIFKFDQNAVETESHDESSKYSPEMGSQKKSLRDSSDTKSFIDMPRFSPKEFEVIITVDEESAQDANQKPKSNKNLRNLTIDLSRRDSDLEKELLEFEKLYTCAEEKKVKTPTLKIKATSLDSSDSMNLSLPQKKTLEVPQNSVSVPNTPKRQYKRILAQKSVAKWHEQSGFKIGYNSLQSDSRRFIKGQPVMLDSGIFLRENHANLMLYQPSTSRNTRRMGSFDENMADFAENPPEINISNDCDNRTCFQQHLDLNQSGLGCNLSNFKQNLSVSSTNLKTLPEGVPSNDFEPTVDEKVCKKLHRRGSNQSLMVSLEQQGSKYSTLSLQSSNCSLNSVGTSCHNLASMRNSASNFSLNTDNRQKKLILERRNSNASLVLNTDHLVPMTRVIGTSNTNLQASNTMFGDSQTQPVKGNCLLQRRGSNNSLTLNIQNSKTNLHRYSSNSSLNINKEVKTTQRKGLLERRSSNTSLTLNINTSNPQLTTNRGLSISNYNLNGSTCNLSRYNSNQSIYNAPEPKRGILERRSSNTSLTINIQNLDVPRDIEIDEKLLADKQFVPQRDKHRKSLSTENLLPKSYKTHVHSVKNNDSLAFGSHDNLWSNSYVAESEEFQENCGQNLTYVCGDQENEMIYAFGGRQFEESSQVVRNITTKPLSPQTTSEDFKMYLANVQHLQNASSVLTRKQLKDLNNVFQNGYSKVKCEGVEDSGHTCDPAKGKSDITKGNPQMTFPETVLPCAEYQKSLLRKLHQEFWDMPSNFQEKPMVFGSHPKNRYKTILPNEHSRFILKSEGVDCTEAYVNANFIKGHEYTKNSYIATQGPLQNTIYDFWLMVHQNSSQFRNNPVKTNEDRNFGAASSVQSKVDSPRENSVQKVVMLTNFIENNRQKCEKYFPLEINEEVVFENPDFGDGNPFSDLPEEVKIDKDKVKNCFVIKNRGVITKTGYTVRRLHVYYKIGAKVECKGDQVVCDVDSVTIDGGVVDRGEVTDSDDGPKDNSRGTVDSEIPKNSPEDVKETASSDILRDKRSVNREFAKNYNVPKKAQNENEIVVYHYWFHNWADHKCPKDVNALLNLSLDVLKNVPYDFDLPDAEKSEDACKCSASLPEPITKFVFPPLDVPVCESACSSAHATVNLTANFDFEDTESPPTIVHCSAGIGRTGCLIAILNGIKQLNYDKKVDILGIVCNMRLNRGGMVQNSEQYELIHKVLCLYEQICLPNL